MNKLLQLAHWLLVIIVIVSLLATVRAGLALWQANNINYFINNVGDYEQIPDHPMAQFAQAFYEAEQEKPQQALDRLTQVVAEGDRNLQVAAYYNRANIHLRQAQTLVKGDLKRIPSVELAKQDYRTALLLNSNLWDVRYNLEVALKMVPEQPDVDALFDKPKVFEERSIKSVGFRVDLP